MLRNQARLYCEVEPPKAGLRTEMLRLGPGESYTLRWSIWPVAGPDYFDFVNLVRNDWGSNFTVPGAWTFFHPDAILKLTPEQIQEKFSAPGDPLCVLLRRLGRCEARPQADRLRGPSVLDDYWTDFRSRLSQAAARIRQACPEVKVLVYYDTQRDTSETGHERFRDSWLVSPAGQPLSTEWGGVYSLTWEHGRDAEELLRACYARCRGSLPRPDRRRRSLLGRNGSGGLRRAAGDLQHGRRTLVPDRPEKPT